MLKRVEFQLVRDLPDPSFSPRFFFQLVHDDLHIYEPYYTTMVFIDVEKSVQQTAQNYVEELSVDNTLETGKGKCNSVGFRFKSSFLVRLSKT